MKAVLFAAVAATLSLGFQLRTSSTIQDVDRIIGTGTFNAVKPVAPGPQREVQHRIADRLVYLEALLRSRDVSNWPEALRAERMKNIDRLHQYRVQGKFPTNYDRPDEHLPCFMDRDGNFCAVAYLVARSAGLPLAEELNHDYQYATIAEMQSPKLDRWIEHSGLTRAEVITIQVPESRMYREDQKGMSIRGGLINVEVLQQSSRDSSQTVPTVQSDTTQQQAQPGLSMIDKSMIDKSTNDK
jgi:hypothetical protein